MFPGTFPISMAGLRELAEELGVTVSWLLDNYPHEVIRKRYNGAATPDVQSFQHGFDINDEGTVIVFGNNLSDLAATDGGSVDIQEKDSALDTFKPFQTITASDAEASDYFGSGVALNKAGTKLLVSAYNTHGDGNTTIDVGSVYYFNRSGKGQNFTEQQIIQLNTLPGFLTSQSDANFGRSFNNETQLITNNNGTRFAVSAPLYDSDFNTEGRVAIFRESNGTYVNEAFFGPDTPVNSLGFGSSLSWNADGTRLAISTQDNLTDAGAVYIYNRNGTTWTENQILQDIDSDMSKTFGKVSYMSEDGNTLIVGTPAYGITPEASENDLGAFYVFKDSNGSFVQKQLIIGRPQDVETSIGGEVLGHNVILSKDNSNLFVVAQNWSDSITFSSGTISKRSAVYVYQDSDGTYVEKTIIPLSNQSSGTTHMQINDTGDKLYVSNRAGLSQSGDDFDTGGIAIELQANPNVEYKPNILTTFSFGGNEQPTSYYTDNNFDPANAGDHVGIRVDINDKGTMIVGSEEGGTSNNGNIYFWPRVNRAYDEANLAYISAPSSTHTAFGREWHMNKSGTKLFVANKLHDYDGLTNAGEVLLYTVDSEGSWYASPGEFTPPTPVSIRATTPLDQGQFGSNIVVDSDCSVFAVVGNYDNDYPQNQNAQIVKIFRDSDGTFVEKQTLTGSGNQSAYFGGRSGAVPTNVGNRAVRISKDGTKLIIGEFNALTSEHGRAFYFEDSSGTFVLRQTITSSASTNTDYFGSAVDGLDDLSKIVIGAYNAKYLAVFHDSDGTYVEDQIINFSDTDGTDGDEFGAIVRMDSQGNIVATSPRDDAIGGISNHGRLDMFIDSDGTYIHARGYAPGFNGALFGSDVAFSPNDKHMIVGAASKTATNGAATEGSAFVFDRI